MKISSLALILALATTLPAAAQAVDDPVKAVMDTASALWSESDSDTPPVDYFDEKNLSTLYSKSFAEAYREAAKYPVYDEGSGPFGYDVITNGQDGCPLKDIAIEKGAEKDGMTDVKVTFKLWTCVEDDPKMKEEVSEVHFDVINEDGKPVINDIHRMVDGKQDSLVAEMKDIVREGANPTKPEDMPEDDMAPESDPAAPKP